MANEQLTKQAYLLYFNLGEALWYRNDLRIRLDRLITRAYKRYIRRYDAQLEAIRLATGER